MKAHVSVIGGVCGEGDPDPREAQPVTGYLGYLSDWDVSSDALNTVPTYLNVR